jgi:hypothetical protein
MKNRFSDYARCLGRSAALCAPVVLAAAALGGWAAAAYRAYYAECALAMDLARHGHYRSDVCVFLDAAPLIPLRSLDTRVLSLAFAGAVRDRASMDRARVFLPPRGADRRASFSQIAMPASAPTVAEAREFMMARVMRRPLPRHTLASVPGGGLTAVKGVVGEEYWPQAEPPDRRRASPEVGERGAQEGRDRRQAMLGADLHKIALCYSTKGTYVRYIAFTGAHRSLEG